MRKSIIVPEAPKPAGPYAHAVVANGFVFVAGQGPQIPETGIVPDNFKEQVRQHRIVGLLAGFVGLSRDRGNARRIACTIDF